jgi:YegS/Rv2252/BmrU family lipid kinase
MQTEKQKILFIINPISGVGRQKTVEKLIASKLDKIKFDYEIAYTNAPKHATEIAKNAAVENYNIVVAVGGDGSVNEVGQALINTNSALAILPAGSGNGLARHLQLPMSLDKAMRVINKTNQIKIDTCSINNSPFIGMAGIGLDAHIGREFAKFGKRGFKSYVKVFMREYPKYKAQQYELTINEKVKTVDALLVSFANGSQYGNNATIAPQADVTDGLVDICILRKFPALVSPALVWRLFNNNMYRSKYLETIKTSSVTVKQLQNIAHIDGEPVELGTELVIKLNPLSLSVIVP